MSLDDAVEAERSGNFVDAALAYERYISEFPDDVAIVPLPGILTA